MCVLKDMKRRGDSISLSCHPVYKENILLPGDGSQGKFSSTSLPLAEIQVNEHGLLSSAGAIPLFTGNA